MTEEQEHSSHTLIILSVIKNNKRRLGAFGIDFDEGYSAGLVGLAKAINDYDDSPCLVGFYKFAYNYIWNSIFNEERGSSQRKNLIHSALLRIQDKYFKRTGWSLTVEKLAALLDVKPKLIRDHLRKTGSIDALTHKYKNDDEQLQCTLETKNAPLPEETGSLDKEYFVEAISNILEDRDILNDEERKVIRLYFGVGLSETLSIKEITKLYHCRQPTISENLHSGLEKLRSNPRLKELYLAGV